LSDIPTFTDTAKDNALFFDPLSAQDLSEKILYMLDHLEEYREKSRELSKEFEKF
jgi:glycosyltransferase involved in cell wall biosynthesis